MDTIYELNNLINRIARRLVEPSIDQALETIDTCRSLYSLAVQEEWDEESFGQIEFLSKRVEISGKFYLSYSFYGKRAVDEHLLDSNWLELAVALFLKALAISREKKDLSGQLKRYNALFKLIENIEPNRFVEGSELKSRLITEWSGFIEELSCKSNPVEEEEPRGCDRATQTESVLPMTVLFYEGPIARAYLETIKSLGYKPQKIIELVAGKDIVTRKTVGRFLPKFMRMQYASNIQKQKIHYWPKFLWKKYPDFIDLIISEVGDRFGFTKTCIENANSLHPLSEYCDEVESLMINGLEDELLYQKLGSLPESTLLFTGGGIVPAKLLNIERLRFLHIHPGYLPNIRGADCTLWSVLLDGKPSATCFYMEPGIDIGDVIQACWLPRLSILSTNIKLDMKNAYRSVYGFVDPWVRAYVLRLVIQKYKLDHSMPSSAQSKSEGATYHFMSPQLQKAALQMIFSNGGVCLVDSEV